jgi:cytochrome P450
MNVDIPKLQDFDDRNYDPQFSDEAAYGDVVDPYPLLHKIAERGSVQVGDWRLLQGMAPDSTTAHLPTFIVFGYDEIREVYSNTDNFSMEHFRSGLSQAFGSQSLSVLDAPDHPRYRRIFQKAFLPHVVETWSQFNSP